MSLPDLNIIDSHVHLWSPGRFKMSWLEGLEWLNRDYGLEDYIKHTRDIKVEGFVFVEAGLDAGNELAEVKWIAGLSDQHGLLKGIVAAAPVEQGDQLRPFLEELVQAGPVVKGVRRLLQGEADPYFCLQPGFVKGVQLLAEYGLSFDICIYHYQLPGVIELVRRCPETTFILDHIGKPAIKQGEFENWWDNLRVLAGQPNVACKISGMVTEADHQRWSQVELATYVEHTLEAFGEDRVLFGSDWPVVLLASSYHRWVETLNSLTQTWSAQARQKLWAENARRYYRL